jgi:propionate CoA-transferase
VSKRVTREQAAALVKDGDTVVITGSGGGVMEAYDVLEAIEQRFLDTGSPRDLTLVHASGIGDKKRAGVTRFAHKGMVRRVVGGHWGWSPEMQAMAVNNEIEAYNFSQGAICDLYREIAAHRPGLITKTGKYTFVDPLLSGGKLNAVTREDLVERITVNGGEYLLYKAFPVNITVIRGTYADENGNVCFDHEPSKLDMLAAAQAAHNSGGKVICQVKEMVAAGSLGAKRVWIPGVYVDAVVVDPKQMQTNEGEYNPAFSGDITIPLDSLKPFPLSARKVVARRASMELEPGAIINLGFGMPDGVAAVAAEEGFSDQVTMTIEQGIYGGVPAQGAIFGVASNPVAVIDECAQFDFYSGRGLDAAFLGLAQADEKGNINVSKFGTTIPGSGGFIDISQSAKKVVFCGTFTTGGLRAEVENGRMVIRQEGRIHKFLRDVEQITFSSRYAYEEHQTVLYVTERAVFRLEPEGVTLIELAPGIDLEKDVLQQMDFVPRIAPDLREMDPRIFREEKMGLRG